MNDGIARKLCKIFGPLLICGSASTKGNSMLSIRMSFARASASIICATTAVLAAAYAEAQQTPAAPSTSGALSAYIRSPAWSGTGGFELAPGATGQVLGGSHAVGEAFAEIQVVPTRTAELTQAVSITDSANGQLTIAAGTPLFAEHTILVSMGTTTEFLVGPLEWCAQLDARTYVHISLTNNGSAEYAIDGAARRRWVGPLPVFEEKAVSFVAPFRRQIVIHQITPGGVTVDRTVVSGDTSVQFGGRFGPAPFERVLMDPNNIPGLHFRFRRDGSERAIVEAAP